MAIPIAAVIQSEAAVVTPLICPPEEMITPAPTKPIPTTIWEAIRVGSAAPSPKAELKERIVKRDEARETSMWVRSPAGFLLISLSNPIKKPIRSAPPNLKISSQGESITKIE